jgi:glutamate-1-semialdehyde 2,1-aminomutase
MAEEICKLVPSIEQVRLVSSGTEATMSALRLARGFTGRDLIIKFEGCYHGHADSLLVKAGSGLLTFADTTQNAPSSAACRLMSRAHDGAGVQQRHPARGSVRRHKGEIAAVIVEPVAGNMNLVRASEAFLTAMRNLCSEHGAC